MKRIRVLSILASLLLLAACGSAFGADDEEQLKKYETDRAAAVVKGDAAAVADGTADDYTFITANGQMMDKSQLVNAMKSGDLKLTSNDISDLKIHVYGNTAVITGKSDVKGSIGGKDATGQDLFTRVLVKNNGKWQSVALQQTKVSAP